MVGSKVIIRVYYYFVTSDEYLWLGSSNQNRPINWTKIDERSVFFIFVVVVVVVVVGGGWSQIYQGCLSLICFVRQIYSVYSISSFN